MLSCSALPPTSKPTSLCSPADIHPTSCPLVCLMYCRAGEAAYDGLDKVDRLEVFEEYIR